MEKSKGASILNPLPNPFPHVVIDHWANAELVRAASAEWPADDWEHWHRYDGPTGRKLATKDVLRIPPACMELLRQMHLLGDVLGIGGLFPDFNCHAGGMHSIPPGGFLGRHVDAQRHPQRGWKREASAVLFLNEGWRDGRDGRGGWGGELILEGKPNVADAAIAPRFNRLVVFSSGAGNYHRVEPVAHAATEPRKTLAVFFWSHRDVAGAARSVFTGEMP